MQEKTWFIILEIYKDVLEVGGQIRGELPEAGAGAEAGIKIGAETAVGGQIQGA